MKTIKTLMIAMCILATALPAAAQATAAKSAKVAKTANKTKAQRYVELVSENDILKGSLFGVLAVKCGGDTLVEWNSGKRLLPASNMKLITIGSAIHQLGPDFKFATKIGYSGTITDGVLDGDVYIVGGGDPTIASKDSIATPRFFMFSQWKSFLDKAGIKKINGMVIGDGRYFDGMTENDCWDVQDVGNSDAPGCDGLCWYENVQEIKITPGAKVGDPVTASVVFPTTPWMKYSFLGRTAKAGTGDEIYYYTSSYVPYGEVRGGFAIDRKPKVENFANKFGAYTCAYNFVNYLTANGIEVSKGPADIRMGHIRSDLSSLENGPYASKVDDLTIVGTTYSPTLKAIARECNHRSDNFYAETLFRTLGRQMHHSASYDSSYVAIDDVLKKLGADPAEIQISDGSGLSRHNYVSPRFFVRFLTSMMDSPSFGDYVATIGQPGKHHYASRMSNESEAVKERIHMKSGSMNGVRCFSGYIEPTKGARSEVIVFSVMTNNALVGTSKVDPIIDKIIGLLATEN